MEPSSLIYRAEMAGRRINDNMGKFVAEKAVKLMIAAGRNIRGARVGVLGLSRAWGQISLWLFSLAMSHPSLRSVL